MNCPICGSAEFAKKSGEYRFSPPPNIPGGEIKVSDAIWWECGKCGEQVLSHELDKAIDREANQRLIAKNLLLAVHGAFVSSDQPIISTRVVGDDELIVETISQNSVTIDGQVFIFEQIMRTRTRKGD